MKKLFKGFYQPSDHEIYDAWRDKDSLFIFDTNVLLNLYGYAEQTREDFFGLLESIKTKIWLPFNVALEYQRRRLSVIKNEKSVFDRIDRNLEKIDNIFKSDFAELNLGRRFPQLNEHTKKLYDDINKHIESYKISVKNWDGRQPCVRSHDSIREKLDTLFDGRVGDRPSSQDWLDNLFKEGVERYKNNIPPGFKDKDKSKKEESCFHYDGLRYETQYGDLILWMQMLEKISSESIKKVFFVTDDAKEDWWFVIDSRGKKQVGPHANLQSELYRKSNLDFFCMYNTYDFMKSGRSVLEYKVHESSFDDIFEKYFTKNIDELENNTFDCLNSIDRITSIKNIYSNSSDENKLTKGGFLSALQEILDKYDDNLKTNSGTRRLVLKKKQ